MKTYDMVIVGGGPGGSMAALAGARLGLNVLMVERDHVIGSPVRCAEGVDHKGLTRFFEPDPKWIATTIKRYYLVAPDRSEVEISVDGQCGYILERLVFDRMIAEEAAKAGAHIMTGVEATALSSSENNGRTVTLASGKHTWDIRGKIVIAADGVESRVARWAGIDTSCALDDMETCAQATLAGIDVDHEAFYLHFTRTYAPVGYAWVFPKGPGVANVGLGISGTMAKERKPVDYLDSFITDYYPDASVVSRTVGGVQCSGGIERLSADGLMVVGDAAHMANPMTGGGIINAMIAGEIAAETARDTIEKGDTSEKRLKSYTKRCDSEFAKMNRLFHKVKQGIHDIPNDRFDAIAHDVLKLPVEKRSPVRILRTAMIKRPALLALLPRLMF